MHEKILEYFKKNPQHILLGGLIISVGLMLIFKDSLLMAFIALFFAVSYFVLWATRNIKLFAAWVKTLHKEFSSVWKISNQFVRMICGKKEGERKV